jgi:hypothetical protein
MAAGIYRKRRRNLDLTGLLSSVYEAAAAIEASHIIIKLHRILLFSRKNGIFIVKYTKRGREDNKFSEIHVN